MAELRIRTAEVFEPLLKPARYKGAKGGRGSGKSHFFAELMVEDCARAPGELGEGLRCVCIREVLKDLKDSAKLLLEDKLAKFRLGEADGFKVFRDVIQTPKDGVIIFKGMQDYSAESIKSLEGFRRAWIEEAQTLRTRSLTLLRPTIRLNDSEIWASWNPRRRTDAIDDFLVAHKPDDATVVTANWSDNPWFPEVLDKERLLDLQNYPERYPHIWGGEYATIYEGAYFAGLLAEAKTKGRIGVVAADPLLPIRAFIDIGGAGATADAFTIWIVQWVGQQIRVLDYYESVGQVLAYHVNWLRKNGYQDAILYLPHDGVATNNITGKRYEDHLREAGFKVEPPIKNQGRGAAMMRIEALRRLGPQLWFNEATTVDGREALGFYHEKRDEGRNIGLGPEHDWSSHAADSLGLMAIAYEDPARAAEFNKKLEYPDLGYV
ncbi:PBSX family phage terminase large subunit [Bradyrhizobium ottawaense]|uniref:PBSX family phage terminase large subunit n=1 Tax=Bradyrhizobium ottawaense TaxID=931866 RepID=UPI0030F45B05